MPGLRRAHGAALWRGPGGRYCSLADCKKEAQRKRAELDAGTCAVPPTTAAALLELSKKIKDLTQRVEQAERTIFKQDCELERLRNPEYAHFDRARQREAR